jgi:glycosyltransferase involved in cell wall biosynthesis
MAGPPRVFYGVDRVPALDEPSGGGLVKFQRLAAELPNSPADFNVLYLGSSSRPSKLARVFRQARERGAAIVWNQNGVAYPGWSGWRTRLINRELARGLKAADYVFFQSRFCKHAADTFLGEPRAAWEVLHNPVDTQAFTPGQSPGELTLVLGGSQYQRYRLETALETVALLGARLIVTGPLSFVRDRREAERIAAGLVERLRLHGRVEFTGPYSPSRAPDLLRRGSLLLHTKYLDPCPGIVLEGMSCGLPVVYSASGGVPELVGDDAGIGIPAPLDFERDHPPDPAALADAVTRVAERLADYRDAARRRAVEHFDLRPWIARHRAVFESLLA